MNCKVVVFPGSNCDHDCFYVVDHVLKGSVEYVWHKEHSLGACDFIILPGGFSYGDYLRCGSIARFSPIMNEVIEAAKRGVPILGICNGFQVLLEAGLLPGAMLKNKTLQFICEFVNIKTANNQTRFSNKIKKDDVLSIPIAHGEGNYYCDDDVLNELEDDQRIIFKYCTARGDITYDSNPNGSRHNIAGIMNKHGNVLGMMPHPERCSEADLGSVDGRLIFESIMQSLQ